MELKADLHTHTLKSGHAYGTIREMAQAASEKHLDLLGLTEHGPGIPGTTDPFYFGKLDEAPKEAYGVRLLYGCEINVLNGGKLGLDPFYINLLDYAIAGVHTICYEDEGIEKNTDNVIACMKEPKVKILAHPDDNKTPLDYKRLVPAAKEYSVVLEVNCNCLRYPERRKDCHENYKTMLGLCQKHQVPIIIDTDAHDPGFVGVFDPALEFLKTIDFDESLVLNTDAKKTADFLLNQPKAAES